MVAATRQVMLTVKMAEDIDALLSLLWFDSDLNPCVKDETHEEFHRAQIALRCALAKARDE